MLYRFGILKSKSVINASKSEELIAKVTGQCTMCSWYTKQLSSITTGLEALCKQKEEEILSQKKSIKKLHSKLLSVQERHKIELQQLKIEMQQELYMARNDVYVYTSTQKNSGRRKKA